LDREQDGMEEACCVVKVRSAWRAAPSFRIGSKPVNYSDVSGESYSYHVHVDQAVVACSSLTR